MKTGEDCLGGGFSRRVSGLRATVPRVVASGNASVPWTLLKLVDEAIESFRLFMLNAPDGVPDRLDVQRAPDDVHQMIGESVARLVPDGATLQMGIGAIPDAAQSPAGGERRGSGPRCSATACSAWSRPGRSAAIRSLHPSPPDGSTPASAARATSWSVRSLGRRPGRHRAPVLLRLADMVTTVIAGMSVLCTGRCPRRLFDFNLGSCGGRAEPAGLPVGVARARGALAAVTGAASRGRGTRGQRPASRLRLGVPCSRPDLWPSVRTLG
jgi:hypothetical protein